MTVPVQTNPRTVAVGNGITTQFSFGFLCVDSRDLSVTIDGAPVAGSQYTVGGLGQLQGGNVTFFTAPASGAQIVMALTVVLSRATDYQDNGDLFAQTVNLDFDRLWLALQSTNWGLGRALVLGLYDVDGSGAFRANQNRIQDLADPIAGQDAANRQWVQEQIAKLATDDSGQVVVDMLADTSSDMLAAGMVGFRQNGIGAIVRDLLKKARETVSITDFGADPTGVLDSRAAILMAADYVSSLGGGRLYYPPGRYRITAPLTFGDGSNSASSTKHHNIVHYGSGVGTALDTTMPRGGTEIFYDGAVLDAGAVGFAGPMHGICFEDIHIDCNGKAAWGVNVVHVTDSFFKNVSVIRATKMGLRLRTRTGNPPGVAYGCSNNVFLHCNNFFPASEDCVGISLDSGGPEGSAIIVNPANNDFIGGVYFYGHSAFSKGVHLRGTDNNTFRGTQFIPNSKPSFGYSVYFEQWPGDPVFPMENVFDNIGASDPVGGSSGTFGNTFTIFQEGDGIPIPMLPYVNVYTHTGKEIVQGKRALRIRDVAQVTLNGANQDSTSATYVAVPGLTATLTGVLAGSRIRVTLTARVGKLVAGAGEFVLYLNGVAQLATRTSVPANAQFQNTAMSFTTSVAFGGDFAAGMYFASDDGNIVRVSHGVLTMEELA